MSFVSHRGRKGSLSAEPAASRSSSSVRLHSCRRKSSSLSSAVCKTGGTSLTAMPDADRLGFEDGSGKVFAEIGGVLEEGCFEGSGSVAHGSRALGAAAIRSVRSTNFAMTSSSSRARKMTSPWSRAFHSVRFIISLSMI